MVIQTKAASGEGLAYFGPEGSASERPRMAVFIGGDELPGAIEIEVVQNAFLTADTFKVSLSLSLLEREKPAFGWAYWASVLGDDAGVMMDIWFGTATGRFANGDEAVQAAPFFKGYVDEIHIDPIRNEIDISGRDGSALLIETKSSEKFPNRTASEIATILAQRHGLTPMVTPTSNLAGRFYEAEHARLTDESSEWDLLTYLAQQENFECYVEGDKLYFGPPPAEDSDPFVIEWRAGSKTHPVPRCNVESLSFGRNLIVANVEVRVHSWNRKLGRVFKIARQPAKRGGQKGGGRRQVYTFNPPDLDQAGVEKFADDRLREITIHEQRLSANFGADTSVGHRTVLRVQDTGTAFDGVYYPSQIRRLQSYDRGFTTMVEAKNHPTRSTVDV